MLEGRVAVVTGGGQGIGRCHALELARHGACVVVNDLGVGLHGETGETVENGDGESAPRSPADEVVATIEAMSGTAVASTASVTDFDAMAALVAQTVARFGRLDVVVNNAGIVRDRMLTSMSEADFDAVVAVHLKGTFNLTKHACDHWRAEAKAGRAVSGRVVNTTSGSGLFGNVGQTSYGAAKAAIASFTLITAMEMDRYGVTCNAIAPLARTRMTAALPSMQDAHDGGDWDPMDPANCSPVVAWVASEASGWLSGAVLRVDGNTVQRVRPWEIDRDVQYRSRDGGRLDAGELDGGLRRAFGVLPRGTASTRRVR